MKNSQLVDRCGYKGGHSQPKLHPMQCDLLIDKKKQQQQNKVTTSTQSVNTTNPSFTQRNMGV